MFWAYHLLTPLLQHANALRQTFGLLHMPAELPILASHLLILSAPI